MKRTPLKRKTPLRARKISPEQRRAWNEEPVPRTSKASRYNGRISNTVREKIEYRCRGICEMPGCSAKATQHHHRKRQAQGGKHTVSNIVKLCHACHHVKIHGNSEWAYRLGWLVKSFEDPATVPWGVERAE